MGGVVFPPCYLSGARLTNLRLKRLPAMRETWVQSLDQEDPLEKEMATHSSILAWRIPWTEEPSGLQSMGSQRVRHDWATSIQFNSIHMLVWARLACESPGVFGRGMGQLWPAAGSGALNTTVHAEVLLKEVAITFITTSIVWPQTKQQGGNTAQPINRKLN